MAENWCTRARVLLALLAPGVLAISGIAITGGAPPLVAQREAAPQENKRVLRADDLLSLADVSDPQISPDGARVAFTVRVFDRERDRREAALWLHETRLQGETEPLRLSAPGTSARRPRFSPDGKRLAFLAARPAGADDDEEATTQVWGFDLRGGDAQPLTRLEREVESFEWLPPDGRRLLLVLRDEKPKARGNGGEQEEQEEKPEPIVIDRLQFKRDYEGYLDRRRTHLYLYDLLSAELRQITSGDYDDDEPAVSPDGRLVVFTSNRSAEPDRNDNTDVFVVAIDNVDRGADARRLTTNPGSDGGASFAPDGATIAYVTATRPEIIWYARQQLAVVPAQGGAPRLLLGDLDRNVVRPRFGADGAIYFLLEDSGEQHLARVDPASGKLERLTSGERAVEALSVAAASRSAALLVSEPGRPADIALWDGAAVRPLGDLHRRWLEPLRFGRTEAVSATSKDGTAVEVFVTYPPDYDPRVRYPTLLWIHGGPVSQYDTSFDFTPQLFAAHGYLVLRPNPRGSSGYGEAFSLAIWASWGQKDYEDVMAAVDWAIGRGIADPQRLGVGGWSYGGILTNHVIVQTDRFAAAMSGASEVLYISNYGHDHYQREWEAELGLPWENRELWERLSPWNRITNVKTPTLVMGGALDWNVPILNSEQLYQALKRLGVATELVVYPGEHHGISRPSFQLDRLERWLAWFDRWCKGERAAPAPTGTAR